MDLRVGPQRKLSAKELMLLNCGVGEDSLESRGQQRDHSHSTPKLEKEKPRECGYENKGAVFLSHLHLQRTRFALNFIFPLGS